MSTWGGAATPLGDAVGFVVVAASPEPPLEADDCDLVVPTDAVEQVDQLARVAQEQVAVVGGLLGEPPHRCLVVQDGVVFADQENERQRVGQADPLELGRGCEREVRVAALQRALEATVGEALRSHGERMFGHSAHRPH